MQLKNLLKERKTKHKRPPSPITFAPDPRYRPISPITFATPSPTARGGDYDYEPVGVMGESLDDAAGYDEDDEWSDLEGKSAALPSLITPKVTPITGRRASFLPAPHLLSPTPAPPSVSSSACQYTLLRFSTGQTLEDDMSLSSYDIRPGELLEVHRMGVVVRLAREEVEKYVAAYWEGSVRALMSITRSPDSEPQLKWTDRWVVVSDGVLSLFKDQSDVSLSSILYSILCSIRVNGLPDLGSITSVYV